MIGARTDHVRALLSPYLEVGLFGSLEVHAVERIAGACVKDVSAFDALSVASAVWATQQGHVCFDLMDSSIWLRLPADRRPDVSAWSAHLTTSPLVHVARSWSDSCDSSRPLVYRENRIFLARQWIDEDIVAEELRERISLASRIVDTEIVDSLFSAQDIGGHQHAGVLESVRSATSILTGGPGTGKTYTIARILVAAVRHGVRSIALAAPTAKAAVQMRESLSAALASDLPGIEDEQRRILERVEPTTIHRLLGHRTGTSTRFRHDSSQKLSHELIVIDEMSMVSLPLMARFLEAVDTSTTLVLVGDPGQLDSVENGSILRDLVELDLGTTVPTTELQTSRRNAGTRSSAFSEVVRSGDVERALEILGSPDVDGSLRWIETSDPIGSVGDLTELISTWRVLRSDAVRGEVDAALAKSNDVRVLCPHRDGRHGVDVWNEELAKAIGESRDRWRIGDIVVKTRNDLGQGLANGDVGVVVRLDGTLTFAFRHGDAVLHVPVAVDDAVQRAFATTVHKAQGSEFATVAVVVPAASSPLCTRELLYTAMTRAKPNAVLIGAREDIVHAISSERRRSSGLAERITEN